MATAPGGVTTDAASDAVRLQKLEEQLDPEMQFRPLAPSAGWLVAALLLALSCFHYYTAGFGLLPEATHRGIHLSFVLGLIFLVFSFRRSRSTQPLRASVAHALRHTADRLGHGHCGGDHQPLPAVGLSRPAVPRRQSRSARLDHGLGDARRAARGDQAQRRARLADHRHRAHRLCDDGTFPAGHPRAPRQHVEERGQSPLPHRPGNLWHRARRRGDVRLPLRAVRRAGHAHWPRPPVHRSRHGCGRTVLGRARKGLDLCIGLVRDDLRLIDRQHRDGGLAHHSDDDPHRLSATLCGRRRVDGGNGRPDHAADHGRGSLSDGRVSEPAVSNDHHRGHRAGLHALLRRLLPGPLRGAQARDERHPAKRAAERKGSDPRGLADRGAADRPAGRSVLGLHALPRRVLGHHGVHRDRPDQSRSHGRGGNADRVGCGGVKRMDRRVADAAGPHSGVDGRLGLVRAP